jgi:hypothetical protein
MTTEVTTALIGAVGTIIVALIGVFGKKSAADDATAASGRSLTRHSSRILLVAGVFIAAVILAAGYVVGESQRIQKNDTDRKLATLHLTSGYQELVKSGLESQKDYVIPEMLMLITLEKSADGRTIDSTRQMFYSLQLLKQMTKTHPTFTEQYHSAYTVDHMPGADPEDVIEPTSTMKSWNVLFDAPEGTRRLLVTGVHVQMPMQLQPNHAVHMFQGLGPHQDGFCYPNSDGDVIGELVIAVESHTLNISLPGNGVGDAILKHENELVPIESIKNVTDNGSDHHQFISARFVAVNKNDVAGLRVQWNP